MIKKYILAFFLCLILTSTVLAHSGRTDAYGCHTNKKTGEYHCHTPKSRSIQQSTTTISTVEQERKNITQEKPLVIPIETYFVTEVIDGDTIKVSNSNRIQVIRFVGIDAPELTGKRKCYAQEAKEQLKKLILNKRVNLITDKSGDKDKYSRLLRYVYYENQDVGEQLIKTGHVKVYTQYKADKLNQYQKDETTAKKNKLGLWKKC